MTALQELRPVHGKPLKKNRWPGIIFVLVFHAFAIYALATGLANSTVALLRENIKAVVTTEDVKNDLPPPPPPPPPPPTPAQPTTSHAVTADDYPPVSIRLQEQGKVAIKYTIATDGSVTECAVTGPSGKPRLDDAACTMVKKRWKFKPATQDGKPVAVSLPAEVIFALK